MWLDKKAKVNFKFYDVADWITNNWRPILPNFSRNKVNQKMKFGQLRKIFFFKNYPQNVVEKLVVDPFIKIKVEYISG